MKHTILLLALLCIAGHIHGQRVTNVTAEQQGQELLIHYQLEADGPVEVQLYLSTDRGSRWEGPLKSCTGDVGSNIAPGMDKRIRWNVLQDRELVGDGIAFKVVSNGGVKKDWLNPALTYGSVTDIDGNTYATIQIGTQVWMAENLRTTRFRNGEPLPHLTDAVQWFNHTTGAWTYYDNDTNYNSTYGKLYNWYVVTDTRQVCPAGWHLPTDAEWTILSDYFGDADIAGGMLKATMLWDAPNAGATNESGFSGLAGGYCSNYGHFNYLGSNGYWWSATSRSADNAWRRALSLGTKGLYRGDFTKRSGLSVRCLMD
jgi:uncharacterized protein (TIGR02145 family)